MCEELIRETKLLSKEEFLAKYNRPFPIEQEFEEIMTKATIYNDVHVVSFLNFIAVKVGDKHYTSCEQIEYEKLITSWEEK